MAGERWRLLRTWDAPPGFNMAFDEALLVSSDATPVLRLYTWSPGALSLGYFQRFDEVVGRLRERLGPDALPPMVRRLTGGGAIHHVAELTFSIAVPASHPLYAGPIAESYERVHAVLASALRKHGARAEVRAETRPTSDDPESPMCFHGSAAVDLIWDGRKGVGSAQRRTREHGGRVLHHGSIKLGTSELEGAIATVDGVAPEELGETLVATLALELGVEVIEGAPEERELLHARARERHFGGEEFLRRR